MQVLRAKSSPRAVAHQNFCQLSPRMAQSHSWRAIFRYLFHTCLGTMYRGWRLICCLKTNEHELSSRGDGLIQIAFLIVMVLHELYFPSIPCNCPPLTLCTIKA